MCVVTVESRYIEKVQAVAPSIKNPISVEELSLRIGYNFSWTKYLLNEVERIADQEGQEWAKRLLDLVVDARITTECALT